MTSSASPLEPEFGPTSTSHREVDVGLMARSFDAVYSRNYTALFRLATMMVSNPAEGEEIAQEAFVRWYARKTAVDDPDRYLRTVVINLSRDGLRRRYTVRRRAHLFQTEALAADAGSDATPSDPMLDVVMKLPTRQKASVDRITPSPCNHVAGTIWP
jgi:RNA polymerase sigma-70 factor, ECF subfamily